MTAIYSEKLTKRGHDCTIATELSAMEDAEKLKSYDVIFPCWTMDSLTKEQEGGITEAVRSGVGLAGVHGGMCDAFRGQINYQWMTGGQFLHHPAEHYEYTVCLTGERSPITEGMPKSFPYKSEFYYMMVEPSIRVLADAVFESEDHNCRMPVVWTKQWGKGKVFYCSLGHAPQELIDYPQVTDMVVRGVEFAAR